VGRAGLARGEALSATIGRDARPASSAHARSRGLLACLALLGVLSASAIPARAQSPDPASTPPEVVPETPEVEAADIAPPVQDPRSQTRTETVDEPVAEPVPPTSAASQAPVAAPAPDAYAVAWTEPVFEQELARLVAAHPARVRVTALGTSKQGRRIALLTIGDQAGDPDRRPAALLATDLEARFGERPGGPEAALHAIRALLERAEREPEMAELLAGITLYAVPAPDPDGAFAVGATAERTCRLERNFPAGWQPSDAVDCPQGPYPCSEPETRELARFVASATNVGALALLTRTVAAESFAAPDVDSALARIAARTALDATQLARARDAVLLLPGSLAAFARARAGACVLALDPWSGAAAAPGGIRAGFQTLPVAIEALLRELPRLEARSLRAERLRERLWLVEVELRVSGGLPTASAEERAKAPASVWLDVDGARVSKIGSRREGQPVGNLDVPRGTTWRIGHLHGNESVRLFLAVEGDEGGVLKLAFRSLRGGRSEFDVPLGG